jgi:hypothetical protein
MCKRRLSWAFGLALSLAAACSSTSGTNVLPGTVADAAGGTADDASAGAEDTSPGAGADTVAPPDTSTVIADTSGGGDTTSSDTTAPPACDCDDGNPCTTDLCSKEGVCSHGPGGGPECVPTLVIDTPKRGETLVSAEAFEVAGSATNAAGGPAELTINGQSIPVGADGQFYAAIFPSHGINVIEAVATADNGYKASVVQSALVGDAFYPTQDGRGEATIIGDGVQAWLGKDFWDDGDPNDLDDFSAITAAILQGTDIMTYLPASVTGQGEGPSASVLWCDWVFTISNIAFDVGPVHISTIPGGLAIDATLQDIAVEFSATSGFGCPDAIGTATIASASITGTVSVSLAGSGGIAVGVPALDVQLVDPVLDITDGFASFFDWVFNWFNGTFANIIESAVEDTVQDYLVPSIQEALESFTVFSKTLTIPSFAGITKPVDVTFAVEPTTLFIDYSGMKLGLGASIVAANGLPDGVKPPPGALARQDCLGEGSGSFELPLGEPFALAMHDDLLSQLLYGAFYGGLLHLDIPGSFIADKLGLAGVDIGTISLRPMLPPVITSCPNPGTLTVQLGDFAVDASLTLNGKQGSIGGFIFASANVTIKAVPTASGSVELGLGLDSLDTFTFQVTDATGALDGSESVIELLFREVAKSLVLDAVGKGFLKSFPVPKFDISSFSSGLPSLSLSFAPESVSVDSGFTVITGSPTN